MHTHTHTYIHIYIIYVYMYKCTYDTYKHTHTNTNTHTNIGTRCSTLDTSMMSSHLKNPPPSQKGKEMRLRHV